MYCLSPNPWRGVLWRPPAPAPDHPALSNHCDNKELAQSVKKAADTLSMLIAATTKGINPFNGFLPVNRCHPFSYLLIKLVSWLSHCWTHQGSQLFVSLSKSNWLCLCYIQPFSHTVGSTPSFICRSVLKLLFLSSLINNLWIIICSHHSVPSFIWCWSCVLVICLIYCQSCKDKLQLRSLWLHSKTQPFFTPSFHLTQKKH